MQVSSVLEAVVPNAIWVSERPIWFGGVRLRSRTTVVRLPEGGLWVHSPSEPNDDVCAALDALGEVRWIVVPNRFHHLQVPATAARYPHAHVVGPRSVRNPKVKLTMGIDDPRFSHAIPELTAIPLDGVPFLDETVFFHRPSGSLIGADLLMCACARDHWTWRLVAVTARPSASALEWGSVRRRGGEASGACVCCAKPRGAARRGGSVASCG
jgi:hypothetical protein